MGEIRNVYKILVGKPEGKGQFERPRYRWGDNIKMNLIETGLEGVHNRWRIVMKQIKMGNFTDS
jgi:hypothetical protein